MPEIKSKIKNPASVKTSADAKVLADKPAGKQKSKAGSIKLVKEKSVKPKASAAKAEKAASANLTVSVYGLDGKTSGKVALPAEIFGEKVNKKLLAQAVRVYQANKRQGNASTKTRGEVDGSTRKFTDKKEREMPGMDQCVHQFLLREV
jgi:Ribosomal protein L4